MKSYIIAYAATAVVFFVLDFVWLSIMGGALYRAVLGDILLEKFSLPPAAIFYVIYVAGIVIFAIAPALGTGQWTTALLYGALFGFCAYATYDLSNAATLRNWTATITMIDLAWGTFLTACSATAGYLAVAWFVRG